MERVYNRKNPLWGKVFAAETAVGTGLWAVASCKLVETYIYLEEPTTSIFRLGAHT